MSNYEKMKEHLSKFTPKRAVEILEDEDFCVFSGLTAIELATLHQFFREQL